MTPTPVSDVGNGPNQTDDEREKHTLTLQNVPFQIAFLAENASQEELEQQATEQLIAALRSGRVKPEWSRLMRSQEERQRHTEIDEALKCTRCSTVSEADKREIWNGDKIEIVCQTCADTLQDQCNQCRRDRTEWDVNEQRQTVTRQGVVEYLCTTCSTSAHQ